MKESLIYQSVISSDLSDVNRVSGWAAGCTMLTFILLSGAGLFFHELWLDEAHHWLLTRDSTSVTELVHNARYDGHPLLWNLLLFFLTRFSANPIWMQVLHAGLAGVSAWLVFRYAPFPRIWKVLFVFGYFPLYEYNWLARNYAPGVLLLFLACALYRTHKRNYPALSLVLALLANVHVLFLVLALVFGLVIGWDFRKKGNRNYRQAFYFGCLVFVVGIALSAAQVILLNHHFHRFTFDPGVNIQWLGKDLLTMEQALFPIPDWADGHFWNSNLLLSLSGPIATLLSIVLWLLPGIIFRHQTKAILFFYGGALGIVTILHLAQHGGVRYVGLLYVWWVITQWIATEQTTVLPLDSLLARAPFSSFRFGVGPFFWYSLVIVQLIAGFIAVISDLRQPFSEAKNAVRYLQRHNLANQSVAVSAHNAGPPISAYLGKKVYYPEIDALGSFCLWNTTPFFISQDTLLARIGRQAQRQNVILVLNHPLDSQGQPVLEKAAYETAGIRVKLLARFDESIMRNENYYLYQVNLLR